MDRECCLRPASGSNTSLLNEVENHGILDRINLRKSMMSENSINLQKTKFRVETIELNEHYLLIETKTDKVKIEAPQFGMVTCLFFVKAEVVPRPRFIDVPIEMAAIEVFDRFLNGLSDHIIAKKFLVNCNSIGAITFDSNNIIKPDEVSIESVNLDVFTRFCAAYPDAKIDSLTIKRQYLRVIRMKEYRRIPAFKTANSLVIKNKSDFNETDLKKFKGLILTLNDCAITTTHLKQFIERWIRSRKKFQKIQYIFENMSRFDFSEIEQMFNCKKMEDGFYGTTMKKSKRIGMRLAFDLENKAISCKAFKTVATSRNK